MRPVFFITGFLLFGTFLTNSRPAHSALASEPLWFNSGVNNRDITFSPDGNLMLTTLVAPKNQHSIIAFSQQVQGTWTPLTVAPFSGEYPDIEAAFHPNGRWVYFASKRPKPDRPGEDWDLWRASYESGKWSPPENLGSTVNTTGNEFYPSVTLDGTLYFTATRKDTLGFEDLYRARLNNGAYSEVENLGAPVNSPAYEYNAFIAPDESYLIFGSQGRADEIGGGDLYISKRVDQQFGEPRLLDTSINTIRLDYCPTVFADRFYFTSEFPKQVELNTVDKITGWYQSPGNGLGDIYQVPLTGILNRTD